MEQSKKKKQYGLLCLLFYYAGLVIIMISAFIPTIRIDIKIAEQNLNTFQIFSKYSSWTGDVNPLLLILSWGLFGFFFFAVGDFIFETVQLKKNILPRIANDECINHFLKGHKTNLWISVFHVIIAGVLILIECEWDVSYLLSPWDSPVTTMTYIPLLFQIALYFVIRILKPGEDEGVPSFSVNEKNDSSVQNTSSSIHMDEEDVVELLVKYKELLDNRIITEEEYNQKKQELLRRKDHE